MFSSQMGVIFACPHTSGHLLCFCIYFMFPCLASRWECHTVLWTGSWNLSLGHTHARTCTHLPLDTQHGRKGKHVCSYAKYTNTHQHTQRAVIKKRWHPGRSVWEKTMINESTAFPHFLFLSHPSFFLLFYTLSHPSLPPSVFFLSSAGPQFLTPSVIAPPRSPSSPAPFPHLFLPSPPSSLITFIFTHLYPFPPSSLSDNVTASVCTEHH